jgi:quercetin dioxygenase-like cupin family protein
MIERSKLKLRRGLAAAVLIAGAALAVSPASAGQCPADKLKEGVRATGEMKPKAVTDTVLGMIELGREKVALADRRLRLRKLVIQPGGIVPWHSHEDRPALIYVVSGSIHEYASNCSVAIEHKAGEVSIETRGIQHWWKNNSKGATVLLSADLFHDDEHHDEHTM